MKLLDNKINFNIVFWSFLLLQFSIMFIFTFLSPMENDEYAYSFIFTTSERIMNIPDVIQSIHNLYFSWSGRILYNGLFLQSLLLFGKVYLSLINAFAFSLLGFCIFQINGIKTRFARNDFIICIIFYSIAWLFLPDFASIIWIAGSANYLWPFIIFFLFIFPFIYNIKQVPIKPKMYKYIFPIIAFAAGLSTEIFSVIAGISILMIIIASKRRKIQTPRYLWVGFIFFIIGTTILLVAPGNYARAAMHHSSLWNNLYTALYLLYKNYFYQILSAFSTIIFFIIFNRFSRNKKDLIVPCSLLFGAFVSVLFVCLTPEYSDRILIPATIIIFIVILYIFYTLFGASVVKNKYVFISAIILVIFTLISQFQIAGIYEEINTKMMTRDAIIKNDILIGNRNISLPPVNITAGRYVHYVDISNNPNADYNSYLAKYWEVDSIILKPN